MPVVVAGYGYLGDGPPPSQWGADAILDSPGEIDAWIANLPPERCARAAT
jgi:hypothetical protein